MKSVIVLFGKPGAGKGTRLSEFLEGKEEQFDVLSVGTLLKKVRMKQTELSQKATSYMDSDKLVPDDIINAIVIEELKAAEKPVFIDGFPRTVAQAEAMLGAGIYPIVIEFYIDDDLLLARSSNRIVCPSCGEPYTLTGFKLPKKKGFCDKCGTALIKRLDDCEQVVLNRLKVYQKETYPILDVLAKANVQIYTINNSSPELARAQFAELLNSL